MDITKAINDAYEAESQEAARMYVGASGIGSQCDAELALSLRGFPNNAPSPKLKRIFAMGHAIEAVVIADLKKAGCDIQEVGDDGKQFGVVMFGGHVRGHADGIITVDGEKRLLEIKSMNAAKFKEFVTKTIRCSHPHYYHQVQFLLGMMGMDCAVLVAYNKDTSEYHHEWIYKDLFAFSAQMLRVDRIVVKNDVRRVAKDRSDWRCKMCFKRDACWTDMEVEKRCSTCSNGVAIISDGDDRKWGCTAGREFNASTGCAYWNRYEPGDRE